MGGRLSGRITAPAGCALVGRRVARLRARVWASDAAQEQVPSGPSPAEGGCAGTRVVVDAVERHVEQAVVARLKSPQGIADERFNEPFTAGPRRHSPR
jgi:hypothetical protein